MSDVIVYMVICFDYTAFICCLLHYFFGISPNSSQKKICPSLLAIYSHNFFLPATSPAMMNLFCRASDGLAHLVPATKFSLLCLLSGTSLFPMLAMNIYLDIVKKWWHGLACDVSVSVEVRSSSNGGSLVSSPIIGR